MTGNSGEPAQQSSKSLLARLHSRLNRVVTVAENVLLAGAGTAVILMMLLTSFDVLRRQAFNSPIIGAIETVSPYLMAAVVWLSLAFTQRLGRHVKIDVLVDRFPPVIGRVLGLGIAIVGITLFMTISIMSLGIALENAGRYDRRAVVDLPESLGTWFVVLGGVLLSLRLAVDQVASFAGVPQSPPPVANSRAI